MSMRTREKVSMALLLCAVGSGQALAQSGSCPARPGPGSVVQNPLDLYSSSGVLSAAFTLQSEVANFLEECYVYQASSGAVESPTLRLNPGDRLELSLTNRLSYVPPARPGQAAHASMTGMSDRSQANNPCTGGTMTATSTNIHFHGLNIPPVCHQDEVIDTDIENTDPPFKYNFRVPSNDSPGMYWYHPHLHGEATLQVNGGATGALIIEGMEKLKPEVASLPERVLIIRQEFQNPNSWIPGPYELTLNYQAIAPPFPLPEIQMQPGATEFWRVANSSSQAFVTLAVLFGKTAQSLKIIALDGIPVTTSYTAKSIILPPAARAEFVVTGPAAGQSASLWQQGFDTGPIGNPNLAQELAVIQATTSAKEPPALPPAPAKPAPLAPQRFAGLSGMTATQSRTIYFAEATNGTNGPTEFFITVAGQVPKVFSMSDPPAITTQIGQVEDWTVENHSGETHAFHIHQLHFLFMATNGVAEANPELRDTVVVPAWSGTGPYPSVKLRLDFRDPEIAGTFVFHCHVLDHEDAGMMAKILVQPK
ncbi:MAG TPA: multicopper oxidase domain-containing protein [Steroidobacteraceae bacterium]